MKKTAFLSLLIPFLVLTSCQSNENKALGLIDKYMQTVVYDFNSYEAIQIQIDSAYTAPIIMEIPRKYAQTIIETESKLASAHRGLKHSQSSMALWKPDGYSSAFKREQYNQAKTEVAEYKKNIKEYENAIQEAKKGIKEYVANFQREYLGWVGALNYRCNTRNGNPSLGEALFIFDPSFNEILFAIPDLNQEELEIIDVIEKYSVQ